MRDNQIKFSETLMRKWLSCWLYLICAMAGILGSMIFYNWGTWPMWKSLIALGTIALILHVMEEWQFPGGFYYMYNAQHGTTGSIIDRYPMSQQTDMFTNLIPILYGFLVLITEMPYFTGLPFFGLCVMEVIVHTLAGFQMKKRFAMRGKKTIYNPGFITTWFCFFPLLIAYLISFLKYRMPTIAEAILAILITISMTLSCINGAEALLKRQNSPYPFTWGLGYFKKFDSNNTSLK